LSQEFKLLAVFVLTAHVARDPNTHFSVCSVGLHVSCSAKRHTNEKRGNKFKTGSVPYLASCLLVSFTAYRMSEDNASPAARTARLAKLQYEEGVDLFATNWSSFHRVAQSGDIRGLRMFLLEAKVNVDTVNAQGDTALNLAAFAGQQHVVDELLKHGADSRPNNKVAAQHLSVHVELRHH
jgi:Ankyrin repeats (3 copies)